MVDKRTLEFILTDQREEMEGRADEALCQRREERLVLGYDGCYTPGACPHGYVRKLPTENICVGASFKEQKR